MRASPSSSSSAGSVHERDHFPKHGGLVVKQRDGRRRGVRRRAADLRQAHRRVGLECLATHDDVQRRPPQRRTPGGLDYTCI